MLNITLESIAEAMSPLVCREHCRGLPHIYTAAGALYGVCPGACIYYFGLSWWAIWFQFIILVTSIPVGVSITAVRSAESRILAFMCLASLIHAVGYS